MATSFLTNSGSFTVGCNYWASHAGTHMWRDWRPDVIQEDLHQLAQAGLKVLRVFPLWPDFQPLTLLRTGAGEPMEFRHGEQPLDSDEAGKAGVSKVMIERFRYFADCSHENGLELVVGLITGWMSGRLFVPPAFETCNVLSDPLAIQWETRLVRYFVRQFKDHPAIAAWDLGNECNCMAPVPSREAAWTWTSAITNAIRVEDSSRPVVSGMHGLLPNRKAKWTMQDQGELTDLLTTHPYPYFTPHCDQDPVDTIRTILHSTAESRFYADIGGKPCIAEELGTLGPMIASERIAANFVRSALFSLWAHNCHGLMWWCAFDQINLEHAPYDWHSFERELGLVRTDRTEKPVLGELGKFSKWISSLPNQYLPDFSRQAVCILTEEQDTWGSAYSSFVLAKQAGFDLEFQHTSQPLKSSKLYLVPSVRGGGSMPRTLWFELLRRVEQEGATLYLSLDDGLLSPFNRPFGLEVQSREKRTSPVTFKFKSSLNIPELSTPSPFRLTLTTTGAEILARESDGNPIFTHNQYGKGDIYFLSVPIEKNLSNTPGGFSEREAQPFWQIYQHISREKVRERVAFKNNPLIGLTEHIVNEQKRIIILINYSPVPQNINLLLDSGWQLETSLYGICPSEKESLTNLQLAPNDAAVWIFQRS